MIAAFRFWVRFEAWVGKVVMNFVAAECKAAVCFV
jgi:hypothetical protein